jgi:type IV pilus assembly protein PilV
MFLKQTQTELGHISVARRSLRGRRVLGSTLIEVLVALLLLSFTLLGIAGLMSATTRYQLGVNSRSVITLLFNDLTSRVRSNNASTATAYVYNSTSWSDQQAAISAISPLCGATDAVACSPDQRAAYDVWDLRTAVRWALPQGGLLIAGNPDNGLTMSFLWFDKDIGKDEDDPTVLRKSKPCASSMTPVQLQSCCPTAAEVESTPGVRCLNFTFIR